MTFQLSVQDSKCCEENVLEISRPSCVQLYCQFLLSKFLESLSGDFAPPDAQLRRALRRSGECNVVCVCVCLYVYS